MRCHARRPLPAPLPPPFLTRQIGVAACIGAIRWIHVNLQNYSLFADI